MNVDNNTLIEMLEEILPYQWQPGDLTIQIVMEKYDFGEKMARTFLDQLVREGKAEVVMGMYNKRNGVRIYRKLG